MRPQDTRLCSFADFDEAVIRIGHSKKLSSLSCQISVVVEGHNSLIALFSLFFLAFAQLLYIAQWDLEVQCLYIFGLPIRAG